MKEAIRADIITEARKAIGDVVIEESPNRGGIQFRTLSNLDFLLELETITIDQRRAGLLYWRLRDLLTRCDNPLFRDVVGEEDPQEPIVVDEITIEDPITFITLITRRMLPKFRAALDAACAPICKPKYILIQTFGDQTLIMAFEQLETSIAAAHEEMKNRLQRMRNGVDSAVESYV